MLVEARKGGAADAARHYGGATAHSFEDGSSDAAQHGQTVEAAPLGEETFLCPEESARSHDAPRHGRDLGKERVEDL